MTCDREPLPDTLRSTMTSSSQVCRGWKLILVTSFSFTEHVIDKQGKKVVFFDKGAKRDWANSLDKDMTTEIEKTFNKEMTELGYL